MKNSKSLLCTSIAAAALATAAVTPAQAVDVSASAAISNFYLWRGFDLSNDGEGGSAPAVSGDITLSAGGAYGGIWASSGDEVLGQEYDLYLGYGGEVGDFSYDISYWTYIYPSSDIDAGDAEDIVLSLGYGPVGFTLYENISEDSGAEDTRYVTLDYTLGDFNFLVGQHDTGDDKFEHFQISYSYNDNLSFTASKGDSDFFDDDVIFNIAYSIDIE